MRLQGWAGVLAPLDDPRLHQFRGRDQGRDQGRCHRGLGDTPSLANRRAPLPLLLPVLRLSLRLSLRLRLHLRQLQWRGVAFVLG